MNDSEFKTLLELASNNNLTQRELSKRVGLSLGGINYVLKALIKKGYVKAQRFKDSDNKISYLYVLTPKWMYDKARLIQQFFHTKMEEYNRLQQELETLKKIMEENK